jgi:hypothetical protein
MFFSAATLGQQAIRIGMIRDEVIARTGPPVKYFDAGTRVYLDSPPLLVKGPLYEIHTRKSATNEYEINVNYTADATTSRLHPTLRIDRAFVRFDHPEKAIAALQGSAEIAALCAAGCKINVFRFRNLQIDKGPAAPAEICVSDEAKTESIFLKYFDEKADEIDVAFPDAQVSEISIEPYFNLDSPVIEAHNAGTWRTPQAVESAPITLR